MQRLLHDLMFWSMLLTGGLSLAACVLLPAWIEREHTRGRLAALEEEVAGLRRQVQSLALQIQHHERDPAYNERFVRQEFNLTTPGVEVWDLSPWAIDPRKLPQTHETTAAPTDSNRWVDAIEQAALRHPSLSLFVLDETRPFVMMLSGLLFFSAIGMMLAGRPAAAARNEIVI